MGSSKSAKGILLKYWELIFFLAYLLGLITFVGPELKWDYDGHDASFLLMSLRIWAGQIPFRDFYPWYGPLYHYLLALFSGLLGNDLYAVKFYIDIVSPLLSMVLLILALRNFGLPRSSRFFVLVVSIYLGLERIYYCGSLRSLLPVFLISWLFPIFQKRQKIPYFFIFPGALLVFFFSPESGIYAMLTSIIFIISALLFLRLRKESFPGAGYFMAGTAAGILMVTALYFRTGWLKNYLEFVSVLNSNLLWSQGAPLPDLSRNPALLSIFSLPLIYMAGLSVIIFYQVRDQKPNQYSLLVWTLLVLGVFLSARTVIRFRDTHMQFAFLPALIIASLIWVPPLKPIRPGKTAVQILLVLVLAITRLAIYPVIFPAYHGGDYKEFLGVRVSPDAGATFGKIKEYYRKFGSVGKMALLQFAPLGVDNGKTPELPFDDLHYIFHPQYRQMLFDALSKGGYQYLLINEKDLPWDLPRENVESFFDYVDDHYAQIISDRPLHVYKLRKSPVNAIKLAAKQIGPIILDRSNNFTAAFSIPSVLSPQFADFTASFKYQYKFMSRLSMPVVWLKFDGNKWSYPRKDSGAQRVNPLEGEHPYRAYLYYPANTLTFQVSFPGLINFAPEQIIITEVRWSAFDLEQVFPREIGYAINY